MSDLEDQMGREAEELTKELEFGYIEILKLLEVSYLYYRYDFDSGDNDDMDEHAYDVHLELKRCGYMFDPKDMDSPYVEHDCITGKIIKEERL